MKLRFKFLNVFAAFDVDDKNTELLVVLKKASELFSVDLSNVQISLNAKDFHGISESHLPLSHFGIVNGDILYVNSLEKLDDIIDAVENELSASMEKLRDAVGLSHCSVTSLFTIPLCNFASEKGLRCSTDLRETFQNPSIIARVNFIYEPAPQAQITFTIFPTGNFITLAACVHNRSIRTQLLLPIRDYLVDCTHLGSEALSKVKFLYKQLRPLAICIKDNLLEPILIEIHQDYGLPERLILSTLPSELLVRILFYLPLASLVRLMLCNQEFYKRIRNCNAVWRMQLAILNAKRKPVLDAALSRQRKQQQQQQLQQQQQQQQSVSNPDTQPSVEEHMSGINSVVTLSNTTNAAEEIPDNTKPIELDDDIEDELDKSLETASAYEHFVARYRSLTIQRRNRGMSPVFI